MTGRPHGDLLVEWALALALDDYPDVAFANGRLRMPSWNLRAIYGQYSQTYPWIYDVMPYPLGVTHWNRGAITASSSVHGASAAFFRLTTTGPGAQWLALDDTPSPDAFRLAIVRLR